MNKLVIIIPILISCSVTCTGQPKGCDLEGEWTIKLGRVTKNYEMSNSYKKNRIIFSNDSVELASGFFYKSFSVDDEYPPGRYPFTYYGNREKFRVSQDSFHVYSTPYKRWNSFKIKCLPSGEISLIGKSDSVLLEKNHLNQQNVPCSIKYVRVHVYDVEGSLSLFNLNYKAAYSNDDRLIFEGPDFSRNNRVQNFKLKPGTFKDICRGFDNIEVDKLKEIYPTEISEITTIKLEIVMQNGRTIRSEIQNKDCPDELRLALIPILYGHQRYVYPNTKPIE